MSLAAGRRSSPHRPTARGLTTRKTWRRVPPDGLDQRIADWAKGNAPDLAEIPGDYGCSLPELDRIADIACQLQGVHGAQLATETQHREERPGVGLQEQRQPEVSLLLCRDQDGVWLRPFGAGQGREPPPVRRRQLGKLALRQHLSKTHFTRNPTNIAYGALLRNSPRKNMAWRCWA